ncbi:hypothetical protein EIP86_007760 [Pleurotus ostreatoroseus]|nr:hypothetical protein EIP86_007760 [Pleurotus ostreatoroseus]
MTTRAQRALVRHLHNAEGCSYMDIADSLNMGPAMVQSVILNEGEDHVESDDEYIGDTIPSDEDSQEGAENLELMYPDEKETVEIDATNIASNQAAHQVDEDEDDMDAAEVEQCTFTCYVRCLANLRHVTVLFAPQAHEESEPSPITSGVLQETQSELENASYNTETLAVAVRDNHSSFQQTVVSFLDSLSADLSYLIEPLTTFGCTTELELDLLCSMNPDVEWCTLQAWLELQLSETPFSGRLTSGWPVLERGIHARRLSCMMQPPGETMLASCISVFDFLNALRQPLGHRLMFLLKQNIFTLQHLDTLCLAGDDELEEIGLALMEAGLTPLEWLIIREGLGVRSTSLRSVG